MSYQDADAIVFFKLRQQQVDGVAAPKLPETQSANSYQCSSSAQSHPMIPPSQTQLLGSGLWETTGAHLSSNMPSASSKNVICRVAICVDHASADKHLTACTTLRNATTLDGKHALLLTVQPAPHHEFLLPGK